MNDENINLKDLEAVWFALDGWLDAFRDDDVFTPDQVASVEKVADKIARVLEDARQGPKGSHLRLVKGPEDIQ